MTAPSSAQVHQSPVVRHRWLPRQHGGWAMLLLPLLLGIAASRFDPLQLVLGGAATAGYVASATLQAWMRARWPATYRAPLVAWGSAFLLLAVVLVLAYPILVVSLVVLVPAAAVALLGARPGRRRGLANSLAQVAQALVLVPAAALVSGAFDATAVWAATAVAAGYLVGSVLVVRSVLAERTNRSFALASVAFHVLLVGLALWLLPAAYALVAGGLLIRAVALPVLERRLAGGPRPLRPIHVGLVELASSVAVVAVSFAVPA
jgi:YwiC-like protein